MKYLFIAILLLAPTLVTAKSNVPGAYAGIGMSSCGQYLGDSSKLDIAFGYMSWIQGYLSAMNLAVSDTGPGLVTLPDSESIKIYMDNYCRANPLSNVMYGSIELFKDVRKNRQHGK
jgi:hypothetical protein